MRGSISQRHNQKVLEKLAPARDHFYGELKHALARVARWRGALNTHLKTKPEETSYEDSWNLPDRRYGTCCVRPIGRRKVLPVARRHLSEAQQGKLGCQRAGGDQPVQQGQYGRRHSGAGKGPDGRQGHVAATQLTSLSGGGPAPRAAAPRFWPRGRGPNLKEGTAHM